LKVHAIAAPEEREKSLHYLQRFWERRPRHGQIVAFDRSWYGRVLVERVEGFAAPAEWRRAYEEINEFERMLIADGVRLVKLFLHITPDGQMRRFRNRLANPLKRWKLSYEDFRNRGRWPEYETAIEDMMQRTSPRRAPWHLIPANDKPFSRLAALCIIAERLGKNVSLEPRPLDPKIIDAAEGLLGLRLPPLPNKRRPAPSPPRGEDGALTLFGARASIHPHVARPHRHRLGIVQFSRLPHVSGRRDSRGDRVERRNRERGGGAISGDAEAPGRALA
jgi:hypothetical protein